MGGSIARERMFEVADQLADRHILPACDVTKRSVIVWVGLDVDRIEQYRFARVTSVRDERNAHPRLNGFFLPMGVARGVSRTPREEARRGDCEAECHRQ